VKRLAPDSAKGCPVRMSDIRKYVTAETGAVDRELTFGRTATMEGVKAWIWGYLDDDGDLTYLTVTERDDGGSSLSMEQSRGLKLDEFALILCRREREEASQSKRNMRRANHDKVVPVQRIACSNCGEPTVPHRACGFYAGRSVKKTEKAS
jgi:large subunit ribosomal protein L32